MLGFMIKILKTRVKNINLGFRFNGLGFHVLINKQIKLSHKILKIEIIRL